MNQSRSRAPFAIILLLIGTGSIVFALWLVDHRQAIPRSGLSLAASIGIFFVSYTTALLLYLHWRDKRRAASVQTTTSTTLLQSELKGTIYGLIPGEKYQVVKSFTDYYGNRFEQGETLHFKNRHFLPYHGGHTIIFDERPLYLQEETNSEILENFSEYVAPILE